MKFTNRATRRNALDRLAALSAKTAAEQNDETDLKRLYSLGNRTSVTEQADGTPKGSRTTSSVPMGVRELEVLVALCKAAPLIQTTPDASTLLQQLSPYVAEAHQQVFAPSPIHQRLPPWETLSYDLTTAVLALGLNHPSLRSEAWACIDGAVDELAKTADKIAAKDKVLDLESLKAIQVAVSLLGFLRAIAQYIRVWPADQYAILISRLRKVLSPEYLDFLDGAVFSLQEAEADVRAFKDWKRWTRRYAAESQPLGAMLLQHAFMRVIEESVLSLVPSQQPLSCDTILDTLLQRGPRIFQRRYQGTEATVSQIVSIITNELKFLDLVNEEDFVKVGLVWQQRLGRETIASGLRSYLCCTVIEDEPSRIDVLMNWLDRIAVDPVQLTDGDLAQTVLKCMAVLAPLSGPVASDLTQSLPRLLVQGKMTPETAFVAGECLARVLKPLPQDVVISTLYNLGNVISVTADGATHSKSGLLENGHSNHADLMLEPIESAISLVLQEDADASIVFASIVQTMVSIAVARSEMQVTALVIAMLSQKIGKIGQAVDEKIIVETATLGLCGRSAELKSLLAFYARVGLEAIEQNNAPLARAILEARTRLAIWIKKSSPFFEVYLVHLLSLCIGAGDVISGSDVEKTSDATTLTSRMLAQIFRPLALLVSTDTEHKPKFKDVDEVRSLSCDSWFNIVVHGYTLLSASAREHTTELQVLAQYSLPLIDEAKVEMPENSIVLNPVLQRRGGPQYLVQQKTSLINALPQCESDIKGLSYPECIFLNAALMVSILRAQGGDCTAVLLYFLENKVKTTALGNCMLAVANQTVDTYLREAFAGKKQHFAAPQVALQLATFFEGCCHRIAKVQQAAIAACDRIVTQIPSALCQKPSLFALLELLTLMWKSCLDTETDEYDWKSHYTSAKGNVSLKLSDDVEFRHATLRLFHRNCKVWVSRAIEIAPLDVKGLLQAYLEDYEDDGAYGHIALGRSFAVEMGSVIPNSDQRLTSLSQRDAGINTASDFIAQYTTRQEYRNSDGKAPMDDEWALVDYSGKTTSALVEDENPVEDEATELRELAERLLEKKHVPFQYVRSTLRNAAGILSKNTADGVALVQDLVAIPFIIFTKQSINLGISLWLGVVKENPSLESRIFIEVAAGWEASIRRQKGFFNPHFKHLNPFYIKEEFAPSRWEAISKRLQVTQNLIAPHLRLIHFLSSHFNASRLASPSVEHIYARLMRVTLLAMGKTVTQPLAREVHFQLILLALKVLKFGTHLQAAAQWRLKDAIISAGLSWFRVSPRWSFGSNKLQIKAEIKLLGDVIALLRSISVIGAKPTRALPALQNKQDLLLQLIRHEVDRLLVWTNPLTHETRGSLPGQEITVSEATISTLLATAWSEDPRIAIQLASRFPSSHRLSAEIRQYLLREPEKAISDPDALYILLGAELPDDVQPQLKYLLYWAPINPMAAVTYFLPAYKNHPLVIQYAVRALESHSVDVTFFYVPQIVQALRYDALGYVQRYIVETAKFSQLFAHQIIWNMKANAYKDEESMEPDSAKPILDKVTGALISSFSAEDKVFYEREFDFFGKVTGISGTLKPFIKRPKPEKKQKIEEELRKIEVEVGVYLPSNPDGVVIGIDRKSGRPLQSHAKAPFMATFRIRKEELEPNDGPDGGVMVNGYRPEPRTYEVWQSAIFKVGDDCRQDVLALQLIAAFRGIFNNVGLDVFVFPYRVTATAPGCGVIDVLPNSISRDMLGREAVNGLYEYFVTKYGYEDSIRFQEARSNFIKSMAAYSIISYLLQFKDRHNGNIMLDDDGHILHIDFGFCFDIVPGGVKFERAPFKLTPEMVAVMGGSITSQPFRAFEELCVKVFLAARQHVEQLSHIIMTMLDSGLPCFKPTTIQHFKERFVLEKSDREAAEFVRKLVHWSERSYSTGVYDYYQLLTNGIPY